MKKLLRSLIITFVSLYLVSLLVPGLQFSGDLKTFLLAVFVFWLVSLLAKPLIKIIMLPINFLTLGLFFWASNLIVLFITSKLVSSLKIVGFDYPDFSFAGVAVQSGQVSVFWSALLISILLSLFMNFLFWLCKEK